MAISITKPTVGGSEDSWGDQINTALDTIVTEVNNINTFPSGGIVMWSGAVASIPTGWNLCDGTNGTPNLIDRFIVGSGTDSGDTHDIGDTGGDNDKTLAAANIPAHSHTFSGTTNSAGDHNHGNGEACDVTSEAMYGTKSGPTVNRVDQSQSESKNQQAITETAGAHTHTVSGTTSSYGSGQAFDNRPAYYALAFIMKA